MKKPAVIYLLLLFCLLALPAQAAELKIRIIDLSGNPIPEVTVTLTIVLSIGGQGPTSTFNTDADGRVTLVNPVIGGSACQVIRYFYTVAKPNFQFSLERGEVPCNFGSFDQQILGTDLPRATAVSAADYRRQLASEMIATAFGENLATTTVAATLPLGTTLGGRSVMIKDAAGIEKSALLLFVSPSQINYVMPSSLASGTAMMRLIDESGNLVKFGFIEIRKVAPGSFTANADGQGVPAAIITRVKPGNVQTYEPVARFDEAQRKFVPIAVDLGPETELVVLSLFGTGWRQLSPSARVSVIIAGIGCPVEYIGKQPTLEGLDQINARLPRELIGKGDVSIVVTVEDTVANFVQLKIK